MNIVADLTSIKRAMRGLKLAEDDEAAIATMIEHGAVPCSLPPHWKVRQRGAQPSHR